MGSPRAVPYGGVYFSSWFFGWQKVKRCYKFTKLGIHVILRLLFFLNFFQIFSLIKVSPKVPDHSDANRVILWAKLAFRIAFYTFNFLAGIFIFKPYLHFPYIN